MSIPDSIESNVFKEDPIRILHVDDDSSFLEISKQILLEMNSCFIINSVSSVDEALQRLSTEDFDIVVSDYEMPRKDGLDFIKIIKELKISVPFILFTGRGREEVAIQALNLGADGYFNKRGSPETVYGELAHGIRKATEHKKAQEALKISQKFSQIFRNGPVAISITRLSDGKILDANEEISEVLGYLPNQVINKTTLELNVWVNPEQRSIFTQNLVAQGTLQNHELNFIKKDGKQVWVNVSSSILEIENEHCLVSSFVDITEYKRIEALLSQNESKYRLIAENSKDVIWTMNLEGHFTYVSPSVYQLRGYTPEEVLDQSINEALTPQSAQMIVEEFQRYNQTGNIPTQSFEVEQPCKDGSTVWTEVNFNVVKDRQGFPESIIGVSRNISERKKAKERLESLNEKLCVVGSLTRHDVANKLMVVKGNLFLLKRELKEDSKLRLFVDRIEQSINQTNAILEFSRLYEKVGAEAFSSVDVEACFDQATKLIPSKDVKIVNQTHGLTVLADSLLQQLFYNLIDNSIKHGKNLSQITLSYNQNDPITKIVYEDNGVGIAQEDKEKIFSGDFTTGGSGHGLKLVKKMIEAYGWTIAENGIPGKGARFEITIG